MISSIAEASKNKNFSKLDSITNKSITDEEIKKLSMITKEEEENPFLNKLKKDYETFCSKDYDLEETLGKIVSFSSVESCAISSCSEGPHLIEKIGENNGYSVSKLKEKSDFKNELSPKGEKKKKKLTPTIYVQNHPFKNIAFNPFITEEIFKNHLLMTYKGLVYARRYLEVQISEYKREKSVNLKSSDGKVLKFIKYSFFRTSI